MPIHCNDMDCSNKTWDPINGDRQNAILPRRSFRIVIQSLSYELYALNFEQKLEFFHSVPVYFFSALEKEDRKKVLERWAHRDLEKKVHNWR